MEPSKETPPLDIPALMADIRARVAKEIAENPDRAQPLKRYSAQLDRDGHWKAGALQLSEDLHFLNTNWQLPNPLDPESLQTHRSGIAGRLVLALKRKLLPLIWYVVRPHFERQREFHLRLVKFLNATAAYVDDRDGSNFWELIKKIDYDITKAMNRIERVGDEQSGTIRTVERNITDTLHGSLGELNGRITEIRAMAENAERRLGTVESVTSGLEGIVARSSRPSALPVAEGSARESTPPVGDVSYLLLENRFRGSEDEIRRRLSAYVSLFSNARGPILDLGAGRGELVTVLNEAGTRAYGIDPDGAMVAAAQERKADVKLGEGLSHLRSLPDGSLGGLIATQVVEHLTRAELQELFELCTRKVVAGGRVIFETINPKSLLALSSNYFRDPTHVWPLHPDTLSYAMTLAGLDVKEVRYSSPVPGEALLKEVPVDEFMTPRWAHAMVLLNQNIRQLNELLYGYQDYCVISEVRS